MSELGRKIAGKRKDLGMTQSEFAEKMAVTRQTVSRWEAGTVMPDVDKIGDIAGILGVSCDYLLKDDLAEEKPSSVGQPGRLLQAVKGKYIRLSFFDEETDIDLYDTVCRVVDFEGAWMKVEADLKKGHIEKLIPVSSVRSVEIAEEG